jgi:hypothetical protein
VNLSPNSATLITQVNRNLGSTTIGSGQFWDDVVKVTVVNPSPDVAVVEVTAGIRQYLNTGPLGSLDSKYRFLVEQTSQVFGETFGTIQEASGSSSTVIPVIGSVSIPAGATFTIAAQAYFGGSGSYVGYYGSSTMRAALIKR